MRKETNLLISIVLLALGVDYVLEGYDAAFIFFDMLALTITLVYNRVNYRRAGIMALLIFIPVNIITIRAGLNRVFDLFMLSNLFVAVNAALWYDIMSSGRLYENIRVRQLVFIVNCVFAGFVLMTIILGGDYFLYPNILPVQGEVAMIVVFMLMFEPIVVIDRVLVFRNAVNKSNNERISVQNMLK